MSFWIYQEYLNNSYLQTYVGGFFQGGFFTTIILVAIGLFTIIALGLFAKLRSTRKELEGIISTDTFQSNGRGRGQPVDTRTEQHLIEKSKGPTGRREVSLEALVRSGLPYSVPLTLSLGKGRMCVFCRFSRIRAFRK
ncbi:hypothetical protein E6H18_11535 [Candidatus Bathyarchaeota archaeon]|nr:MAG: hypothetical protein E6H18_11535 [Candidatus Bathyarchaeota archaeon]